jgi:hypothetical protein
MGNTTILTIGLAVVLGLSAVVYAGQSSTARSPSCRTLKINASPHPAPERAPLLTGPGQASLTATGLPSKPTRCGCASIRRQPTCIPDEPEPISPPPRHACAPPDPTSSTRGPTRPDTRAWGRQPPCEQEEGRSRLRSQHVPVPQRAARGLQERVRLRR